MLRSISFITLSILCLTSFTFATQTTLPTCLSQSDCGLGSQCHLSYDCSEGVSSCRVTGGICLDSTTGQEEDGITTEQESELIQTEFIELERGGNRNYKNQTSMKVVFEIDELYNLFDFPGVC